MSHAIKDSRKSHWVNRAPLSVRPYLQLSRIDRPIGYWLLALPGWIGLAFATLTHGFASSDLRWAALIFVGAIAMRGAGCTYNDIVDQDLDAQVERTALRPLPAGTVTPKRAWIWLLAQCAIGLIVLLFLPRLAQIISLCSIPLVAAYPFMKRITWWPQVWLGMTFNWAALVAYAAKTGEISTPVLVLYAGLIFWTIGYDTIYACQDIEDDGLVGIKSTARRFGRRVKLGVAICYLTNVFLVVTATFLNTFSPLPTLSSIMQHSASLHDTYYVILKPLWFISIFVPLSLHYIWQIFTLNLQSQVNALAKFKSNIWVGALLVLIFCLLAQESLGNYPALTQP